jgi:hypothetical protein
MLLLGFKQLGMLLPVVVSPREVIYCRHDEMSCKRMQNCSGSEEVRDFRVARVPTLGVS